MKPTAADCVTWVVLTTGNRPAELHRAIASLSPDPVVVVSNGAGAVDVPDAVEMVSLPTNLGVPGGRDAGLGVAGGVAIGFLDDDAVAPTGVGDRVAAEFLRADDLGAVSFRLVDEDGETLRRHVPRPRGRGASESGDVATFLGGACAIRRSAYDQVGGYFTDLFYGHEELELSWRLIDAGWSIRYLADVEVFHPRTDIGRHSDGWRLTGRNRVLIARRTLPWAIVAPHTLAWLVLGAGRARREKSLGAYVTGWWSGWRHPVDRDPISWRGVWRLTTLGRPPII